MTLAGPVDFERLAAQVESIVGQHGTAHEQLQGDATVPQSQLKISRGGLVVAEVSNFERRDSGSMAESVYDPSIMALEHLIGTVPPSAYLSDKSGAFLLRLVPDEGENLLEGRFVPIRELVSDARTGITTYFLPESRSMTLIDLVEMDELLDRYEEARAERVKNPLPL